MHVIAIQRDDEALLPVYGSEVPLLEVAADYLGHTPNEYVLAEEALCPPVQGVWQGGERGERFPNQRRELIFPGSPQELLEVERIEPQSLFFGGNEDVPGVLLDGNQGARLYVVIASVCDELLD